MEQYTKSYLQLIKPGITISNTMTAVAAYFLAASQYGFSWTSFIGVTIGVACIIASACVVNNMTDRDLDAKMKRTRGREIAAGTISLSAAAIYAFFLGSLGFGLLLAWTNVLTLLLGVLAFFWYVVIYAIAKRTTPLSTIIGSVCGALPPVAGYVALSNQIDAMVWVLFGLLVVWQLPHFYAIAVFRKKDYEKAGLPVWSIVYGKSSTKAQIFFWIVIFALLAPLPTLLHAAGYVYFVTMLAVSTYWIYEGARHYKKLTEDQWSRRMFGISLLVLVVMSAALALGDYVA